MNPDTLQVILLCLIGIILMLMLISWKLTYIYKQMQATHAELLKTGKTLDKATQGGDAIRVAPVHDTPFPPLY